MSYRDFDAIDAFVAAVRETDLDAVVLAWQQEYGPHPVDESVAYRADYGRVRIIVALAYSGGCILRCQLRDVDRAQIRQQLEQAGLRVEERCRNLGGTTKLG